MRYHDKRSVCLQENMCPSQNESCWTHAPHSCMHERELIPGRPLEFGWEAAGITNLINRRDSPVEAAGGH